MGVERSRLLANCKAQFDAAPGKAAALIGLSLVLVVIVAVQLLRGPASANASVSIAAPTEVIVPTPMADPVRYPPVVAPPQERPELPLLPLALSRDLFSIAWSSYPAETAQSLANPAETEADNQEDKSRWTLHATCLTGVGVEGPLAVINGVIVRLGDQIGGCVLQEIGPRHVVLTDGDERLVLPMR